MDCLLLDNSNGVRWTIRNSSGQEGTVPAACFVIPPPNHAAIQTAQRSEPPKLYSICRGLFKIQVYACICIFHVDIFVYKYDFLFYSLKSKLDNLLRKWKIQYRAMRYNMVLATIQKVKSWDLKQVRISFGYWLDTGY